MDQAAGHRRASHGPRTAFPASIEQEALVMTKVILFALSTRVFLILRDVPYEDTHAMCQHLQVFHLLDRRGVQSVHWWSNPAPPMFQTPVSNIKIIKFYGMNVQPQTG